MQFPPSIVFSRWKLGGLLRITGTDAASFLQGQFTNDLRSLPSIPAVYGLWLNQKGKVLADSFVLKGKATASGEFWVVSYFSPAAEIQRRLEEYIVADDVVIEDVTADWTGISFLGSRVGDWLANKPRAGFFFPGRRTREENWEWIFPRSEIGAVSEHFPRESEIDAETLARKRIVAGIPAVPSDIGSGDLPAEGELETEAISYTKGCYLGQEVMARLKSMGQVRRRLLRVRGAGPVPFAPQKLWQEQKAVGELRSVVADGAGFQGLAMMSLVNLRKEFPLSLEGLGPGTIELVGENP